VSGLVVDAPLRGLGLGRALLLAARRWAKEKGLVPLRVRTRLEREAAARFYESAGMTRRKQQWVFEIEG
jgi:GNAT superfamily N-acetyltransferase